MSNTINNGGPAFPLVTDETKYIYDQCTTLREYAAIKLRVPDSGTDWLDEMIRKSVRDELAAKAMQGFAAAGHVFHSMDGMAVGAYMRADAILRARGEA